MLLSLNKLLLWITSVPTVQKIHFVLNILSSAMWIVVLSRHPQHLQESLQGRQVCQIQLYSIRTVTLKMPYQNPVPLPCK